MNVINSDVSTFPSSLRELVEQQVLASPHSAAMRYEGEQKTYEELNQEANRLAHWLRAKDVGCDMVVAVKLTRSFDMVVALLAVLKAGGAYLPLDPLLPQSRLAFMMADADVSIMITCSDFADNTDHPQCVFLMDEDRHLLTSYANHNPSPLAGEDGSHLAYLMYTSGTTGNPKGVMVEHLGVVNRMIQMQNSYPLQPSERVLLKTPFNFDVSVREFFWTLGFGGTLVIARPEGHKDPVYICQLLAQENVQVVHFVPSMLAVCLQHPTALIPACVKYVMCSGEALEISQVRDFNERVPQARLDNLYGPTEAAIEVSEFTCSGLSGQASVPIGTPLANTELWVLNDSLACCPQGVTGDLYIGGICLARGYLNQPELTREKFIPHPFDKKPGTRLYDTGDIARVLPCGNIEFLGRRDTQISLNGHRIELMEVQYALTRMDGVKSAVVTTWQSGSGRLQILAYLMVGKSQYNNYLINQVRTSLSAQLPDYMIPARFILLDTFPVSSNGKVDKAALPLPEISPTAILVHPSTIVEQQLHALWAAQLKLNTEFGTLDTFISLGGDSMTAIRLLAEINHTFSLSLSLQNLFAYDTIARQAALCEELMSRRLSEDTKIRPGNSAEIIISDEVII